MTGASDAKQKPQFPLTIMFSGEEGGKHTQIILFCSKSEFFLFLETKKKAKPEISLSLFFGRPCLKGKETCVFLLLPAFSDMMYG